MIMPSRITMMPSRLAPISGGTYGGRAGTFDSYLRSLQRAEQQAYLSNLARKEQIESIYDSIIEMYQPGGAFEARYLSQLGTRKAKDVGSEMQQLISSGLYGTTTTAGIGRRWEAEVGEPARLAMEDVMQQRLGMAMGKKAEFLTGIEEEYPDYLAAASLARQAYSAGGGGGGGGGSSYRPWSSLFGSYSTGGRGASPPSQTLAQSQAQTRAQREAYEKKYGDIDIKSGDIIWGEEEAAKLLAEKMVPSTAETIPTATEDIMSRYAAAPAAKPASTTKPTIAEFLQQHGIDPHSTNPADIARARKLQPLYKTKYG